MYNLLVSGNDEAWQGEPFQIELSRCVRQYTSDDLTEQYGALDPQAIAALKRLPCIFCLRGGPQDAAVFRQDPRGQTKT